jgi:primosomal protein N'
MQILQVIPLTQSIHSEVLTYFSAKDVVPGQLVTAPLRKKEISAIVVSAESVVNMKTQLRGANYQIRNILKIHEGQVFSSEFLTTCNTLRHFYATTSGRIIEKFTPTFILKDLEKYAVARPLHAQKKFRNKLLQRSYPERITFYKTLIREKFLLKESLHIMCPTIQEAEDLFHEIKKNNKNCFLLHSSLGVKKRRETYSEITRSEIASVLISTGLFIDTHQTQKSTLVIERESSDHYYSIKAPYMDTRVFIENYATHLGSECIWADSALRPETWNKHLDSTADLIEPFNKKIFTTDSFTVINQNIKKPGKQTDVERISELTESKKFSCISDEAIATIKESITNKERIFVFAHKKSLAPNIVCRDCGNIAQSTETGHPFSLYIKTHPTTKIRERIFVCNLTGESISAFDTCQFCQGWNMQTLGIGTEGVFQELQEKFPKTKIHILDSAHAHTKKHIKEIITDYENSKKAVIVVGTQMAIPHLSTIDTTIISSLDSYFSRMSHSIHPQLLSLLTKLKEKTKNTIVLQSRNITDSSLPILQNGLYRPYIDQELAERTKFNYPPFVTLCTIKRIVLKQQARKEFEQLSKIFSTYSPHILTHPAKSKLHVQFIIILELPISIWNTQEQDQKLFQILSGFDRKTEIRMNPKDLL